MLGERGWERLSQSLWGVFFYPKAKTSGQDIDHLDFKIVVEPKDSSSFTVILVASSRQEKAAWTSDISQVGATREGLWSPQDEELPWGPCWAVPWVWARRFNPWFAVFLWPHRGWVCTLGALLALLGPAVSRDVPALGKAKP